MNYTFNDLMIAYIRGYIINNNIKVNENLIIKDINSLDSNEIEELISIGKSLDLKLYYFKEKDDLARVSIVLGFLKGIYPSSLLDVGSGRGVFLFPLLREFSYMDITSIDILDKRVQLIKDISTGGINNLKALKEDLCTFNIEDNSFDVVTLLEVLEHIPNVGQAIKNACRIASKYIILTVPSKEDDNPEHIHLLTKDKLTKLFNDAGVTNLKFGGVNGHLFMIAKK